MLKNRLLWIDLVRVISALFVIAIHVSGRIALGYEGSGDTLSWLISRCFHEFCNVAVPLFIMVSGAILLNREESPASFYYRRFGKILIPFLVWSVIYILAKPFFYDVPDERVGISVRNVIGAIIAGRTGGPQLWFMYMLIALYLATPYLSVYAKKSSPENKRSFLSICFFVAVIYPLLEKVSISLFDVDHVNFQFEVFSMWVGFFVAGHFLRDYVIKLRHAYLLSVVFLIISLTQPTLSYIIATTDNFYVGKICLLLNRCVFSILSHQVTKSIFAFLILRSLGSSLTLSDSFLGRIVQFAAPLTFGVYLSHMLFVFPIMKQLHHYEAHAMSTFLVILLVSLLVYLVSALLTLALQKIPFLRRVVP